MPSAPHSPCTTAARRRGDLRNDDDATARDRANRDLARVDARRRGANARERGPRPSSMPSRVGRVGRDDVRVAKRRMT